MEKITAHVAQVSKTAGSNESNALRFSLNIFFTFIILGLIAACAHQIPAAIKRDQQMRFDQALNRCEQGFTAYCQQVANGGNYAH